MSKLYKVEMYVLDINDMYHNLDEIIDDAERRVEANFTPFNVQEVEFEWDDDIDLNYVDTSIDTYRKYFE